MQFPSSPSERPEPNQTSHDGTPPVTDRRVDPLTSAVLDVERHVAAAGWDGPVRLFALIRTARALASDPELGQRLHPDIVAAAATDPGHILPVEQEDLPQVDSVEELLGTVQFGPMVDGAALTVERYVLPPEAERELPTEPDAALQALLNHPDRQDVRMAVGVMRDGSNCCAIRTRANDDDASVGVGPDLAPGVIAALAATLG